MYIYTVINVDHAVYEDDEEKDMKTRGRMRANEQLVELPVAVSTWVALSEPSQFKRYEALLSIPEAEFADVKRLIDVTVGSLEPREGYQLTVPYTRELDDEGEPTGNFLVKVTRQVARGKPLLLDAGTNRPIEGHIFSGSKMRMHCVLITYVSGRKKMHGVSLRMETVLFTELVTATPKKVRLSKPAREALPVEVPSPSAYRRSTGLSGGAGKRCVDDGRVLALAAAERQRLQLSFAL
jgi:hypothetical protein